MPENNPDDATARMVYTVWKLSELLGVTLEDAASIFSKVMVAFDTANKKQVQ